MESKTEPCRHCGTPAVAHVAVPEGCVVFPDDRDQWLCAQHLSRLDDQGYVIAWAGRPTPVVG